MYDEDKVQHKADAISAKQLFQKTHHMIFHLDMFSNTELHSLLQELHEHANKPSPKKSMSRANIIMALDKVFDLLYGDKHSSHYTMITQAIDNIDNLSDDEVYDLMVKLYNDLTKPIGAIKQKRNKIVSNILKAYGEITPEEDVEEV